MMRWAGLLLLAFPILAPAQNNYLYGGADYYVGYIGKEPVRMMVQNVTGDPEGFLFYESSALPLHLLGREAGRDSLVLEAIKDTTGEAYCLDKQYEMDFKVASLQLKVADNTAEGVWKGSGEEQPVPIQLRLQTDPTPSPEEIQRQLTEEPTLETFMTVVSRWLTGSHSRAFCTPPYAYSDLYYLPDPSEISVTLTYENLFGHEGKEALLQLNWDNYRSQVFVMVQREKGWETYPEYLDFNAMKGYTSCLYCMDMNEYARVELKQLCDGAHYIEVMACGGRCADGSDRGDYVTRDLYRINDDGFRSVFFDQLEEAYSYSSPCPDATDPPRHTDFEYVKQPGETWPTQVKLTHHVFELIGPKKKKERDCMGGDNYEETGTEEEIIPLCE